MSEVKHNTTTCFETNLMSKYIRKNENDIGKTTNAIQLQSQNPQSSYKTKEGQKPPISRQTASPKQTREGKLGDIQSSPVQRKTQQASGNSKFVELAQTMGQQHGVDTSPLKATHNSGFPSKVNADATIQGDKIDFAPGKDNEHTMKHEIGHYIDNTLNGTPKGDMAIGGQSIDTTREAAADKIADTPLQRKVQSETLQQGESTGAVQRTGGGVIQRMKFSKFEGCPKEHRVQFKKNLMAHLDIKIRDFNKLDPTQEEWEEYYKLVGHEVPKVEMKPQGVTWKEDFKFAKPPEILDSKGEKVPVKTLDFTIKGLGKGQISLYQQASGPSYKKMLSWMSHGLQISDYESSSLKDKKSMGFSVGEHENLFRPENEGGFSDILKDFDGKRGKEIPQDNKAPNMVLGSHSQQTDFPLEKPRKAIGSIVPDSDLAILTDFVPFSEVDEKFQTKEMQYLDFAYAPLDEIMNNLPEELKAYDDFLMLCCRTIISEKLKGKEATIGKMGVQNFDQ